MRVCLQIMIHDKKNNPPIICQNMMLIICSYDNTNNKMLKCVNAYHLKDTLFVMYLCC